MIVSFKSYVMNFVDFVLNCYSHITSHVSQSFTSFTHYTSYSLLNIVHVIVCVFGLTKQVCKYFEFLCKTDLILENLWRMFENLKFGKTKFKTCVFEKLCISYSCILLIFFNAWRILCKNWAVFSKLWFFWNFDQSRLVFDQSKLIQNFWVSLCLFRSIKPKVSINRKSCGMCFKTRFSNRSNTFSKSFLPFLSPYDLVKANLHFFVVFDLSFFKVLLSLS